MAKARYEEWRQRWPALVVQRCTEEAAALLQSYYATTDSGFPAYSGSRFEAVAALNNDPYSIGPADFTAVSMLSVDVSAQAAIRLLGPDADEITGLLKLVPIDRDIIDVDSADLATGSAASQLWQLLRRGGDGLGRTTTSKLIAAKRPRLVPIWDSFVHQATGLDTVDYWRQFQQVLVADDHAMWNWVSELREHCTNVPAGIPNLRLLDVLLWMTVKQDSTATSRGRQADHPARIGADPRRNRPAQSDDRTGQGNCSSDEGSAMTRLNKQEFQAWAYDDLLTNTTRGVLAEYIVAKALGIGDTKRLEWDKHDLDIDGVGVEVKSAAYVQTWEQARISEIAFGIRPARGWDARTNTYAASSIRSADVYVFCLLEGEDRENIDPLDVAQWTFYVLSTSVLNREVKDQKTIRLGPLKALRPRQCTCDELKAAIHEAAAVNLGA